MTGREAALAALTACRRDGAWCNEALKRILSRENLDRREAALATRLAYGVMQNRMKLDYYLAQLLTSRRRLHPTAQDILRLGLYQILELDRVPSSAAVNESVELAKKYCPNPQASSLVNAVLRSAVRQRDSLTQPTAYEDLYSHPAELVALLKRNLPKGTLRGMLEADNGLPDTTVQVNTLRCTPAEAAETLRQEGVQVSPHPWMGGCLTISGTGSVEKLPSFRQGLYYAQDPAAKLAALCASLPEGGAEVLDCCAAPGGKSFAAAIAMGGRGSVTACDLYPHKRELIERGAARLGLGNVTALVKDAAVFDPAWEGRFDVVIADVPCSGLGIIRKKPDIRYKDLGQIAALPELQSQILRTQARYLRPGGVLIYATCTVLRAENEDVVASFLRENPAFTLEPLPLPPVFPPNTGTLTLIPGQYETDGFFIARMRKIGD